MIKTRYIITLILVLFIFSPLPAGERTIPVDIFLMIDKSQSMAESGKFESMHQWVRDQLIGQILIDGDWITLYDFYGKAENLLTFTVQNEGDRQKIIKTIDLIKPDGQYTDIGLALDTIKRALDKRGTNDRFKIMLLLTDLKQEAPWTSRYAGSPEKFDSPYLAEARILQHDAWYEITLDMNIQNRVVKTSKELFTSIEETRGKNADLTGINEDGSTALDETGVTIAGTGNPASQESTAGATGKSGAEKGAPLPLSTIIVIISALISFCIAVVLIIFLKRKKEREQEQKKEKPTVL